MALVLATSLLGPCLLMCERRGPVSHDVLREWNRHRAVIADIVAGKQFDGDQYVAAVTFFEHLTGYPAHDEHTDIGRLPGSHLERDLRAWDEWFVASGRFLYWDQSNLVVKRRSSGTARD